MRGFSGRGRVHHILRRRIGICGCCTPYTGEHGDPDILKRFLNLPHPLTPFAMLAFRPRYAFWKEYSPKVEIYHFCPLKRTHMPGWTSAR